MILSGIFSYYQSSKEIQKQVNKSQMQLLTQMNSNVEQTLQTVYHSFNQLVNSTVMSRVISERLTSTDFILYNDLRKEIQNTQSMYTKIEDIVVVNFEQNWIIKNSGFTRLDRYLHRSQLSNQMMLPRTTSWVMNPSMWFYSEEKTNAAGCPYTISLVKKLPDQKLEKAALVYANLSTCTIGEIINFVPRESETVMILDDQERILYHTIPGLIGKHAINTGFIKGPLSLSDASGQFQVSVDGIEYTASYMRSSFNNWVYLSFISIDSLTSDAKAIGTYTLLFCAFLAVVFIAIAWAGSRKMYDPVKRLLVQMNNKDVPDYPRSNEFDLISERLHDLFRTQTKLEREARQYLQQASHYFLIKIYQGKLRRSEMEEKLVLYGFDRKLSGWRILTVLTLQIDTLGNTSYDKEDKDLLLFAVSNMFEELLPEHQQLPPVSIDQTLVILVGGEEQSEADFHSDMYTLTESIQKRVLQVLGLQISIGISLPFEDLKAASVAYREGLEALKHRIHLGAQVIVPYANVNEGKHHIHLDYPSLTEGELFDAIVLADEETAALLFKRFLELVFKHEMSPQEVQVVMLRFFNNILVMMQESGIALHQLGSAKGSLYEDLGSLHMAAEIEEWFWTNRIQPLIQIFKARQNSQYQSISEKIINMIHESYDSEITIEMCAARLHYNANYLSGVFRKETNSTFSEYLSSYRFYMAKKWLAETDMTIREIAERLQYLNSQNFIRFFKRQEGVTPGQYRESCRINRHAK
ncbi:helix-turn-helix domain-containing protein [Paenibacillus turpanensis]|uniref:helix-turn-helix domain-containing protein n=1 Tax=Paenibacillus turpanensis TaxID=2689078 RepID=UPI003132CE0E